RVRRLVVAIESGPAGEAAVEHAAALAAELGVEIVGVFVEDANLLAVSALPLHEIALTGAAPRRLERGTVERAYRVQAERARRALERAAAARRIAYSFRVSRGRPLEELLRAAEAADVVTLAAPVSRHARRRAAQLAHVPDP